MTINRFPTSLARLVGGALGTAVLLAPLLSCGQESINSIANRHTDNVASYIYSQSYGKSLTHNEQLNLEVKIKAEIEAALQETQCAE